jgi:hypothetical protein
VLTAVGGFEEHVGEITQIQPGLYVVEFKAAFVYELFASGEADHGLLMWMEGQPKDIATIKVVVNGKESSWLGSMSTASLQKYLKWTGWGGLVAEGFVSFNAVTGRFQADGLLGAVDESLERGAGFGGSALGVSAASRAAAIICGASVACTLGLLFAGAIAGSGAGSEAYRQARGALGGFWDSLVRGFSCIGGVHCR